MALFRCGGGGGKTDPVIKQITTADFVADEAGLYVVFVDWGAAVDYTSETLHNHTNGTIISEKSMHHDGPYNQYTNDYVFVLRMQAGDHFNRPISSASNSLVAVVRIGD